MSQALYDLPEGWEWVQLGSVCDFVRGPFGGSLKKEIFKSSGFAVYEQQHAIYNQFDDIRYFIDSDKFDGMKRFILQPDDIIMSCSGTMGKTAIVPKGIQAGIINQALLKLTTHKSLYNRFLQLWMDSSHFQNGLNDNSQGAAIKNVASVSVLKEVNIPLPPLAEQTHIVEKLDAVLSRIDTAIDELQQSLALVDAMFRSGLDKAFNPLGSPTNEAGLYDLPDGWGWHLVKDISQNIQYGHTAKATDSGNAGFLRITDIQDGMINWSGVPFVEVSEKELTKYELQKNDLVFARSGATAGKSILIDEPPKNVIFASYLIRIIPNQLIVFPKYLALFFQSPMYWSIVMQNASGAAQPNINGTKLGEFSVPLPNLAEQQRVVEALDALNDKTTQLKTELTAKIGMFNQLKASVLDGAFRGLV